MPDSSSKFGIDYIDYESVLRKTGLATKIEMAKPEGEWWLSPEEENEIRGQLVQEGRGGFAADIIIGQINKVRFKQYIGEESKPEMRYMNPIGGWFR